MVHPTPALIPQLSFAFRNLPEHAWCSATKTWRALVPLVDSDMAESSTSANKGQGLTWFTGPSTARAKVPKPPHPQHTSLSANAYPLPPSVAQPVAASPIPSSGPRLKQLNNTMPQTPTSASSSATGSASATSAGTGASAATTVRSSLPAPSIFWNDHLRML